MFIIFGFIFTIKDSTVGTVCYIITNIMYLAGTSVLKRIGVMISSSYVHYFWIGVFGICVVFLSAAFHVLVLLQIEILLT